MPPFARKELTLACRGMCLNRPIDKIPEGQFAYLKNVRSYQEGLLEARSGITLLSNDFTNTGDPAQYIHSGYTLNDLDPVSSGGSFRYVGFDQDLWFVPIGAPPQIATPVDTGFSGDPMSLIAMAPVGAPVPWLYAYDRTKQAKYSARYLSAGLPAPYQIGLPIPFIAGTGWISPSGIALIGGPLTGTYFYRYQLRHTPTGVLSQPGPPTGNPADPTSGTVDSGFGAVVLAGQSPQWTAPSIPDPGNAVTPFFTLDVYRWGGTVLDWRFVGSFLADGAFVFTDTMLDVDALGAPSLDFSRFQPWITQDAERKSVVSTVALAPGTGVGDGSGSILTVISGSQFDQNWLPGTLILMDDSIPLTLRRFISVNSIEVNEDTGAWASRAITITGALRSGAPIPHVWGPYGSGQFGLFLFGCEDQSQTGRLSWTNGNDPDSTNPANSLDLTDPSEPLQNGCVYNGRVYCWSTERMWEIIPDLNSGTFIAQVIPGNRGLWAPWALAVGDAMYWVGKDGIYASGGGQAQCITDADFMAFFPHDANPGIQVTLPNPDSPANPIQLYSPHPGVLKTWRLSWGDGMLYFDYLDNGDVGNGIPPSNKALVYAKFPSVAAGTQDYRSPQSHGWVIDDFAQDGYTFRYWEEDFHSMLLGIGPVLYLFTDSAGQGDAGSPIPVAIMVPATDYGDARLQKLIGDSYVDAKPNGVAVTARLLKNYNRDIVASRTLNASGGVRKPTIIDVPLDSYAQNVGFWLSWQQMTGGPEIFKWVSTFVAKPESILKRPTDWDDAGEPMNKFVFGCLIEANTSIEGTGPQTRLVEVHADNDVVVATLSINHDGQMTKPYFFDPVITHQLRLVVVDPGFGGEWELFRVVWKWTLKPELTRWTQDWTDDGYNGPKYLQGFVLEADTQGQDIEVQLQIDGGIVLQTFTLNHAGQLEKPYAVTPEPPIVHEMRLVPTSGLFRYMEPFKIGWVYTKQPEYTHWVEDYSPTDPFAYRGVAIEADTEGNTISVEVRGENNVVITTLSVNHPRRMQKAYSFGNPTIQTEIKLVPLGDWRHYSSRWIGDRKPDLAALYTDWTDDGREGAKFFQGFILWADTQGQNRTLTVQFDGGQTGGVFTRINHNGEQQIAYSFPVPFIAHQVRCIPDAALRYVEPFKIRWIWEPAPELAKNWITQGTSHGFHGYLSHRDCYIALQSFDTVILRITLDDGTVESYFIPSTAGLYRKPYEILKPMKGKLAQYSLTSCKPFRLFQKDSEMRVGEWGRDGRWTVTRPFGDLHFERGAVI